MYLKVDNVEFGPFACWSVHAPQRSVFLQHLKEQEAVQRETTRQNIGSFKKLIKPYSWNLTVLLLDFCFFHTVLRPSAKTL